MNCPLQVSAPTHVFLLGRQLSNALEQNTPGGGKTAFPPQLRSARPCARTRTALPLPHSRHGGGAAATAATSLSLPHFLIVLCCIKPLGWGGGAQTPAFQLTALYTNNYAYMDADLTQRLFAVLEPNENEKTKHVSGQGASQHTTRRRSALSHLFSFLRQTRPHPPLPPSLLHISRFSLSFASHAILRSTHTHTHTFASASRKCPSARYSRSCRVTDRHTHTHTHPRFDSFPFSPWWCVHT